MTQDFLSKLLGNQARARLLRLFAANQEDMLTAPQVGKRTSMPAAIALRECKALTTIGILKSRKVAAAPVKRTGKKRRARAAAQHAWMWNKEFTYQRALAAFVTEVSPSQFDEIQRALRGTGRFSALVVSGAFMGDLTRPVELLIAGDALDERRLDRAVRALEPQFGREIRYAAFSTPEFRYRLTVQDRLIRDTLDFPHVILINRSNVLG